MDILHWYEMEKVSKKTTNGNWNTKIEYQKQYLVCRHEGFSLPNFNFYWIVHLILFRFFIS